MTAQATLDQPQRQTSAAPTVTVELVTAAQAGDRDAFGRLFERYERLVYSVIHRRLGDHAETQELVQDVFIQAMRKLDQLREPGRFAGWIRSIAARTAINHVVRRRRHVTADTDACEAASIDCDTPLARALSVERVTQLRVGLGRLRALDRQTLEAFYLDGRSLLEMSARFDSPVGTIKRRLHVARKRLARELTVH
jgi:RNA polymerase sigma-70 factor (ECF subfamily)